MPRQSSAPSLPSRPGPGWRLATRLGLLVALGHALALWSCSSQLHPLGAGPGVERIELSFDDTLKPTAPLEPTSEPPAPLPVPQPAAVSPQASAPRQPASASSAAPAASSSTSDTALSASSAASDPARPGQAQAAEMAEMAQSAQASPPAPTGLPLPAQPDGVAGGVAPGKAVSSALRAEETAAANPGEQPVAWPRSTRLRYKLLGNYRGEIHGQAQVEWIKRDDRYQTHIDVTLGPEFLPLLRRRMSSEGRIVATGLHPERYEEETRQGLGTRKVQLELGEETVRASHGSTWTRLPQTQDTVSQFVDLTHRFLTRPRELKVGSQVRFPLALPRSLAVWTYDVVGLETLDTPFGQVPAYHLKPRREDIPAGSLTIELWFAPSLQYLPVRIFIRQGEEAWLDLMVTELPQQARGG